MQPVPALRVRGLACRRGTRRLFAGLDFDVAAGEALALVGPNGAGKTSLLRILAGLQEAEAGRVEGAEGAIYVGHLDALKPQMSVAENLAFWLVMLGAARTAARAGDLAAGALERLDMARLAGLPAGVLSAGQRRRLALARLVPFIGAEGGGGTQSPPVARPLWLLDEPDAALDAQGRGVLDALLRAHLAQGGLVVAATHHGLAPARRQLELGRGGGASADAGSGARPGDAVPAGDRLAGDHLTGDRL